MHGEKQQTKELFFNTAFACFIASHGFGRSKNTESHWVKLYSGGVCKGKNPFKIHAKNILLP